MKRINLVTTLLNIRIKIADAIHYDAFELIATKQYLLRANSLHNLSSGFFN